jgi:hypothetical protein
MSSSAHLYTAPGTERMEDVRSVDRKAMQCISFLRSQLDYYGMDQRNPPIFEF